MSFNCIAILFVLTGVASKDCDIPFVLRGTWFYRENGEYANTEINGDSMTGRGTCLASSHSHHVNYTMVFYDAQTTCYNCVRFIVRTVNIVDKVECESIWISFLKCPPGFNPLVSWFIAGCKTLRDRSPSLSSICDGISPDQQLITLFAENFVPVNCRSGLEGVWQFAYQNRFRFTGECNHPGNVIQSCQTPGSQFLITNQKFTISYRKCDGMSESLDGSECFIHFIFFSSFCKTIFKNSHLFISRWIQLPGRLVCW